MLLQASPRSPDLAYRVLAVAVLVLILGPVGAAVVLGFGFGESPCVLCWAQRTAMTQIALAGLFILRFGARPRYVGFAVLVAAWGVFMAVRHSALHLARDIGQGFSAEILGAHTYTWSAFIFWVCLVTMGGLLLLLRDGQATAAPRPLGRLERASAWLFLVVIAGNAMQAFASTGPPPYVGQSDPVRLSWNPRHWVWSLEEYDPVPLGLRGRWAIEKPSTEGLPAEPAGGPLAGLARLEPTARRLLSLRLPSPITGLAHDPAGDRFVLSTTHGVHLADGELAGVLRYTVVDPNFSVDLARFGAVTFLDPSTVLAVSENKSYVVLRERTREGDPDANHRYFLESFDAYDEVTRGRFATVRARMMYLRAAAWDPDTQSIFTLSVPNARTRRLVVSRFDRRDMTLSEEFVPTLDAASGLSLPDGRSLDELYVTAATFHAGRLYALSAAHGTMLAIDPARRAVVGGYALRGIDRPAGMAFRGDALHVVGEDGHLTTFPAP